MPAQQEEVQEYWTAPEGSYKLIVVETEAELEGLRCGGPPHAAFHDPTLLGFGQLDGGLQAARPSRCQPNSHCSEVAEAARVCALDAEWPPEQTAAQPHASLLQLAFWSPQHGVHVLLLVRRREIMYQPDVCPECPGAAPACAPPALPNRAPRCARPGAHHRTCCACPSPRQSTFCSNSSAGSRR